MTWRWVEQLLGIKPLHEVDLEQSGKRQTAFDGGLQVMGSVQRQVCDQRDGNLDMHGILAVAEELPYFEGGG